MSNPILWRATPLWQAIGVILLLALPSLGSPYLDSVVSEILLYAIFAMSLNLLAGYTGMLSFGHAAFFGLGGYTVMLLGVHLGISAWFGLLAGILVAGLYAACTGFFCVRLSGVPFLMLTMAFAQLLFSLAGRWRSLTGGTDGLSGLTAPHILGYSLSRSAVMYYVAVAAFCFAYALVARLIASQLGHVLVGIRENEVRMQAFGYAVHWYKWLAFTISGSLAGFSGGLFVIYNQFVSPDILTWQESGDVIMVIILGGIGTLLGPLVGAAVFLLMKNYISSRTDHWLFVVGTVFVLCVLFFRDGLWGSLIKRRTRPRLAA